MPINTAALDGSYVGGTPGVYYDYLTGNPVTVSQEHWLVPNGPQFTPREVGRDSYENPGTEYWNIGAEKDIPTTWPHADRGMLIFKVQAQNFTNHDNIGLLDTSIFDIGPPAYLNRQNSIEPTYRHLLLWAKFAF